MSEQPEIEGLSFVNLSTKVPTLSSGAQTGKYGTMTQGGKDISTHLPPFLPPYTNTPSSVLRVPAETRCIALQRHLPFRRVHLWVDSVQIRVVVAEPL